MKPCQDHHETLLLDVYGDLAPGEREAWEKHLEACEGCRHERARLNQFLQQMKKAMPIPHLSPEKAEALAESIVKELQREKEERWWQGRFWGFPNRLLPAIATACVMILAFAWFSSREFEIPSTFRTGRRLTSEQKMMAKDLEVIRNLELLEEMEVLEKLVQVVDERNSL